MSRSASVRDAIRATAAAAIVAALMAGCGQGDDAGPERAEAAPAATAAATHESRFVARAEAICKEANEREAALGATGIDWIHTDLYRDVTFLRKLVAVGRSALRDLRRLRPPEPDRERYAEALRAIAQMLRGLEDQIAAVRAGRGNATATYESGYFDLAAVGGPLGFTECMGIVL